jgi:hypothetical protein
MGCYEVPEVSALIAHGIKASCTRDRGELNLALYMIIHEASLKAKELL